MRTAGRTVLFSAVTVAAAMASLIVFHLRFLYSMAYGGALVALTAALVSLTVLPALLAALGPRVNALSLKRWQVAINRDAEHVRSGGVVPVLAARDAPPGADRDRRGGAADRARPAVPADRVHRRRRRRAAAREVGPRRVEMRSTPSSRPGATSPIYAVAQTGDAAAVRAYAERLGQAAGRRGGAGAVRAGDVWRIDVVARGARPVRPSQAARARRPRRAGAVPAPCRRRRGRVPRPAGSRCAARCRSRSRCSARRRL